MEAADAGAQELMVPAGSETQDQSCASSDRGTQTNAVWRAMPAASANGLMCPVISKRPMQ